MYSNSHEIPSPPWHLPSIRLDKDVIPLSQFRSGAAEYLQQVRATGRPMLITLRGQGIVVLLDVREFEAMRERLRTLEAAAGTG